MGERLGTSAGAGRSERVPLPGRSGDSPVEPATTGYDVAMASPRSVRLSDDVLRRLADLAGRRGVSVSSTMERLLDEALRREAHPGITFRDGPSGRRAEIGRASCRERV